MIKFNGYVIDIATAESVTYDSEVTEYPVETGADITDHTRNLPPVLSIEFIVSDTPIGEVAKTRRGNVVPSSEARGYLIALRDSKEPFTVECGLGVFDDMIFESLTETKDATTGAALVASATLRRIEIRDVRRTVVSEIPRMRKMGKRAARTAAEKVMWKCPEGKREVPGNDEYNRSQGCFKVISKDGVMYNANDGTPLTIGSMTEMNAQALTDAEPTLQFDPNYQTPTNPNGQWVYRTPSTGPGSVSTTYPAFQNVPAQERHRTPFGIGRAEEWEDPIFGPPQGHLFQAPR